MWPGVVGDDNLCKLQVERGSKKLDRPRKNTETSGIDRELHSFGSLFTVFTSLNISMAISSQVASTLHKYAFP
jgi:hypothetical protein